MEWEAAERTQTNGKTGARRALIGGEWVAIEKSQTHKESGSHRVMRKVEESDPMEAPTEATTTEVAPERLSPTQERNKERYDPNTTMTQFVKESLKRGASNATGSFMGLLEDLATVPSKFIARQGFPGAEDLAKQDYFSATAEKGGLTDKIIGTDRSLKPANKGQQIVGGATEFATSGLGVSGLAVKAAKNRIRAAATETAAGTVGGASSVLGGDVAERAGFNRAWGEIPAGIVGAVSGQGIPNLVNKAVSGKNKLKHSVNESSKKELKSIVEAEKLEQKIADSSAVTDTVESVTGKSFKPTLAGRTQSKYIAQTENKVLGRDTAAAERATVAHRENTETLEAFTDAVLPESRKTIQRVASDKVRKAKANIDKSVARTNKSIDEAAEDLAYRRGQLAEKYKGKDQQSTGQKIQDDLKESAQKVKASSDKEIKEIYKRAEANNVTASMDDVVEDLRAIKVKKDNLFQDMPPIFSEVLERYSQSAPKSGLVGVNGKELSKVVVERASFREIHSLYKETNRLLRLKDTGFSNVQTHFLSKLKDSLEKKMTTFAGEKAGKVGAGITIWNKKYAEYVKTFRQGAAGDALRQRKSGQMSPSKVTKRFFNPEGIDQYIKINGKNPSAMSTLEDGVLDLFSNSAIKGTGSINPKLAASFIEKHKRELSKLPELNKRLIEASKGADDLAKPGALVNKLTERNARLQEAKKSVSNGVLAQIAKTEDIAPIIERALTEKSRKTFKVLNITGKEGRKAILHSIASAIPSAAKKQGMSGSEFLRKNVKNIRPILDRYGKGHYDNIKTVTESIDMVNYGKPPASPVLTKYNKDPIEDLTGTSTPSLQSQIRLSGTFLSPVHVASSLATTFWRKIKGDKASKMQEYLLTNPDAARDFAKAVSTKGMTEKQFGNLIRPHMYAAGIRSVTAASDEFSKDNRNK